MMAVSQVQNSLKFELLIPYYPGAKPTACMSFNYHQAHFGEVWGLHNERHEHAHTGCVAFGMDRLAVALFANHGVELGALAGHGAPRARSVSAPRGRAPRAAARYAHAARCRVPSAFSTRWPP